MRLARALCVCFPSQSIVTSVLLRALATFSGSVPDSYLHPRLPSIAAMPYPCPSIPTPCRRPLNRSAISSKRLRPSSHQPPSHPTDPRRRIFNGFPLSLSVPRARKQQNTNHFSRETSPNPQTSESSLAHFPGQPQRSSFFSACSAISAAHR